MNIKIAILSIILLTLTPQKDAYRFLVSFPMGSRSHSILGHGVVNHLLKAGHEVVHITSFPKDKPVANLTEINVGGIFQRAKENYPEIFNKFRIKNLVGKGKFDGTVFFYFFTYDFHKQLLQEPDVAKLLSDPKEHFDAVILEWFFSDTVSGIAPLFKCPLIWLGSTEPHWKILEVIDEIPNPAYNLDLYTTAKLPLDFWGRAAELFTMIKNLVVWKLIVHPFETYLYNRVFTEFGEKRGVTMPAYSEVKYNASLLFLNSHVSMGNPFRLPQNAFYIGGYHIDEEVKPLPKDLQKLMDDAKHGVIYFSMGSNLRSEDMSDEMRTAMFKMFSKFKETVIWKYEADLDKSLIPSNVYLLKWAPQQSILAHPNLKIFITHGGQLSTTEAMHYAVPVIGIPVLADQHVNMKTVSDKGYGIKLGLDEDLVDQLEIALKEMLNNPSYKQIAKELSFIYHDRTEKPGKVLVHWIQHVVKTQGAYHMRSPALQVSWYQKMYLDLALVLLIIFTPIVMLCRKFVCKKKAKKEKVKSN